MRVVSFVKPTNLILSSRLKLDSVSRNRPARPGLSTIELRPSRQSLSLLAPLELHRGASAALYLISFLYPQ